MTDKRDFDDMDEDIFADEDISHESPSKGNRVISSEVMGEFIAWLARYHPNIPMVANLPRRDLERLVNEFEYCAGRRYGFRVQDWQYSLKLR